jgi:cation diffusion facilitator CzcD-associated flavoprotein CzcO
MTPGQNGAAVASIGPDPRELTTEWIGEFGAAMESGDPGAIAGLFATDGWLRDRLALTWDLRTLHGRPAIRGVIEDRVGAAGFSNLAFDERIAATTVEAPGFRPWVQAAFTFESTIGRGRGFVRLVEEEGATSLVAWTVLLELQELRGHEELAGHQRPDGVEHGSTRDPENWLDRRIAKERFVDSDPAVVVIGAGQGGLSTAARLGALGVDTLVVERQKRVGDGWRNRYRSLVLHDPVWANHLPYLSFPETWPLFISKDKLADWFEAYASIMELNVWTSSTVATAAYDSELERWDLTVVREGEGERVLHPRHLVFATGASGLPYIPTIPGAADFAGEMIHSSEYRSTDDDLAGKRILVVGAGNSSHDISHDLAEADADVTMLQRSSTYVLRSETAWKVLFDGIYEQDGPDLEDADLIGNSVPFPVAFELNEKLGVPAVQQLDAEMLDGLRSAGYSLNEAEGLVRLFFTRAGGYYIDVGAAAAIAEGKIKVRSGVEIDHITAHGVAFSDGSDEEYDRIILATGYGSMLDVARELVGDEIVSGCAPVWGLDEEGEISSVWRSSGHDGLWFAGGNLSFARHFSRVLALQIKAAEVGLLDRYRGSPAARSPANAKLR